MLVFSEQIFSSFVSGTTNVYTDTRFSELLNHTESLSIFARLDSVVGTTPTITFQFEDSSDGTRWQNEAPTPEVNALGLSVGINIVTFVRKTTAVPLIPIMRYGRL